MKGKGIEMEEIENRIINYYKGDLLIPNSFESAIKHALDNSNMQKNTFNKMRYIKYAIVIVLLCMITPNAVSMAYIFYRYKANNKIGYVPQKAFMFTGSVKENVAYGENGSEIPSEKKIKEAIEVAQGTDFVSKMENTYDAHIARGGTNVSGGQKQRLAIARAIARNPEIYIFDDSFSALDYKTDSTLRKELKKYTKDATSMIVAQRIGTILNADKIIVLDKGKCVGMGTHKELLKTCEVYKEIALSQLSKEELENA